MFVTDKMVFLQLQKTGCTHIANLLHEVVGGEYVDPKHGRPRQVDPGKLVVGSVRNPWDWYVSLWAYGCAGRGDIYFTLRGPVRKRRIARWLVKGNWTAAKGEAARQPLAWGDLYRDPNDPAAFRSWLRRLFRPATGALLQECIPAGFARSAGLLTYRYTHLFVDPSAWRPERIHDFRAIRELDAAHNILDVVVRNERLEADLLVALDRAGHRLGPSVKRKVQGSRKQRTNASKHQATARYYDEETRRLVEEKERLIIDKYDYSFPSQQPQTDANPSERFGEWSPTERMHNNA